MMPEDAASGYCDPEVTYEADEDYFYLLLQGGPDPDDEDCTYGAWDPSGYYIGFGDIEYSYEDEVGTREDLLETIMGTAISRAVDFGGAAWSGMSTPPAHVTENIGTSVATAVRWGLVLLGDPPDGVGQEGLACPEGVETPASHIVYWREWQRDNRDEDTHAEVVDANHESVPVWGEFSGWKNLNPTAYLSSYVSLSDYDLPAEERTGYYGPEKWPKCMDPCLGEWEAEYMRILGIEYT